MTTYIDVSFCGVFQDASIEAAIHRCVARLEAMRVEVQRAEVTVEPFGRNRTMISATVQLTNGHVETSASVHMDPYVCIANAFRAVRPAQPIPATTARRPSFA